ncbi:phage holin family protein [Corallococcus sp. bb12-1]|uniref:phage holin family protein n=1 Tax=Corallococcus sp. bb12-1 TaxID=2996784 RepID=UPI00226FC97E|nr:phage holin family protein [Corallococcus sp. bb12-1]MCY1041036.1 phage holin family protein [Corallococcus sp. bb12-1]
MPEHSPSAVTDESPQRLVSRAIDQSRRQAQAEVELAKEELRRDARQTLKAAVLLGSGALLVLGGTLALAVSLGLLTSTRGPLLALGLGGAGAALGWQGARRLPGQPWPTPVRNLRRDLDALRPSLS